MSTAPSTSSRPQATTPSRVTDNVKNGWDTTASPQSRISWRSPLTKTCPSWRSSCCSVSGTPYDASCSALSRPRGTASRNRCSTSAVSTSSAYRSGSTASRRSGTPAATSRSTSGSIARAMSAAPSRTSTQRDISRSSAITSRSRVPAASISIQPRSGSSAIRGGTRAGTRCATRCVTRASWASSSVLALNQVGPWSVGTLIAVAQGRTCTWSGSPVRGRSAWRSRRSTQSRAPASQSGSRHRSSTRRSLAQFCALGSRLSSGCGGSDHAGQPTLEVGELRDRQPEPLDDRRRDLQRPRSQAAPLGSEDDSQGSLVVRVACTAHVAGQLQALEQRGEGARVELEEPGEVAHRQLLGLPQGEHHQVLRVGEPQRLEHGLVERDDTARRHGQGEADLVVERQRVLGCRLRHIRECTNHWYTHDQWTPPSPLRAGAT